jgi:Mg-chelatase subunit ChlD
LAISANTSFNENVIANTIPAIIKFNKPANVCSTAASDTVLVIDKSGSMADKAGSSGTKLASAKIAASNFVDIVARDTTNKFGLVSFDTTGAIKSAIASDASAIKTQINALTTGSGTCVECGILKANQEISAKKRAGIKNVVVLLTDGKANHVEGNSSTVPQATAETKALNAAISGYNANGTIFFTIGLGNDVNSEFLTKLAEKTGGQYYFSPTTDQLNGIYNQISQIIAKGSVSGNVFNDTNANGAFDQGEEYLPGAIVQLESPSKSPQSVTTDSTGNFSITNLCDGNYTLKQTLQSGWKQTSPANSGNHTFAITNGNAITNKNFGNNKGTRCSDSIDNDGNGFIDTKDSTCHTDGDPNNSNSYNPNKDGEHGGNTCADSIDNNNSGKTDGADPICHPSGDPTKPWDPNLPENAAPTAIPTSAPTATPLPNAFKFNVDVILHGIGSGGDNANPTANSFSNKNPLNPIQNASVKVFDSNNQLFASATGQVTYSSASGSYKGIVTTDKAISTGSYIVRVTVDRRLTRLIPGIQALVTNTAYNIPSIQVVTGDITRDNRLDIRDYNNILDCYSDLQPPVACADQQKKKDSDINDDGNVGQFDYNLFLRELSTQPGE